MGLTVHYKLKAPPDTSSAEAGRLVLAARAIAVRFEREDSVQHVGAVSADARLLNRFATEYLTLPVPGEPNTFISADVAPLEGWLFEVNVGQDCEPLWIGLCRYPATVKFRGRELPARGGDGWRFWGFSKTQYASLHGWEHFLRCHRAVIDLLVALRPLGLRVRITDEGDYWPRRSIAALRRELGQMNSLVAAAAGALKDVDGGRGAGIQSPIFAHKDFERLEAEGEARAGDVIRQAHKEISRVLPKPGKRNR